MLRPSLSLAALAIALLVPAAPVSAGDHDAPEAADELLGRWAIVEGINQGNPVPKDRLEGISVLVTPEAILTHDADGSERYRATYRLTRSMKPHQIDMTVDRSDDESSAKALGIFKETEEGWTLCYALPGTSRPETFDSSQGSRTLLFKLQRPPHGQREAFPLPHQEQQE